MSKTSSGGLVNFSHILCLIAALISPGLTSVARAQGPWWNATWRFRVPVTVASGAYERYDKPAEVALNFTTLLNSFGVSTPFDENSIRVIEVNNSGVLVDASVAFQFDKSSGYNASGNATGTLVFILKGTTAAAVSRYFHVYFDVTGKGFSPPSVPAQISYTDDVSFEGQLSYRIVAQNATYYYHKQGAAFAGLKDKDDIEWIGYHPEPGSGSGGEFRGLPNMVFDPDPGNRFFHPGFTNSSSSIVSQGPVKLKINSKSTDSGNPWECEWEMYPNYARMTLLVKGNTTYWFLYEGIPGGLLDVNDDFVVRSTGVTNPASDSWEADIPSPEWVYFGDGNLNRVLYLAQHEDDNLTDSYRQQADTMTVFGFGRDLGITSFLNTAPMHFTIGFAEDGTFGTASKVIASAFRDIVPSTGAPEQMVLAAPTLVSPADNATGQNTSLTLRWNTASGAASYRLQVATDAGFASGVVVNDSTIVDTFRVVSGLANGTQYYWRVNAKNAGGTSGYSATRNFTTVVAATSAPTPVSPSNGATNQVTNVTIVWTKPVMAASFRLQVGTDSTFASGVVVNDSTLVDTIKVMSGLVNNTKYFWRVNAKNPGGTSPYSVVRSFTTIIGAPSAPLLSSPPNNALNQPTSLTLQWNAVAGASTYWLQLGTDSTFVSGLVKNDTTLTGTSHVASGLVITTKYFWRMSAKNSGGWGPFSEVWNFTTAIPVPEQVVLVSPANLTGIVPADSMKFVWRSSQPGVIRYWFEISLDSSFILHSVDSTLTDTTKVVRQLMSNQKYWWRVRAANASGWGPFSETRTFDFATSVDQDRGIPQQYSLSQNYPNPFNPSTSIEFSLPKQGHVKLEVFSILGENVATMVDGVLEMGKYRMRFDAAKLTSGLYMYRLTTNEGILVRKMLFLK